MKKLQKELISNGKKESCQVLWSLKHINIGTIDCGCRCQTLVT